MVQSGGADAVQSGGADVVLSAGTGATFNSLMILVLWLGVPPAGLGRLPAPDRVLHRDGLRMVHDPALVGSSVRLAFTRVYHGPPTTRQPTHL